MWCDSVHQLDLIFVATNIFKLVQDLYPVIKREYIADWDWFYATLQAKHFEGRLCIDQTHSVLGLCTRQSDCSHHAYAKCERHMAPTLFVWHSHMHKRSSSSCLIPSLIMVELVSLFKADPSVLISYSTMVDSILVHAWCQCCLQLIYHAWSSLKSHHGWLRLTLSMIILDEA